MSSKQKSTSTGNRARQLGAGRFKGRTRCCSCQVGIGDRLLAPASIYSYVSLAVIVLALASHRLRFRSETHHSSLAQFIYLFFRDHLLFPGGSTHERLLAFNLIVGRWRPWRLDTCWHGTDVVTLGYGGINLTEDVVEGIYSEVVNLTALPVHLMLMLLQHIFSERPQVYGFRCGSSILTALTMLVNNNNIISSLL